MYVLTNQVDKRQVDLWSATSMVIANMVGTGVFTSLGYQLFDIQQGFSILMIWLTGGLIALAGAFCYAELANRLPKDGGEFYFLSEIFHPALGYMAGFVSITVGFAAPVAGAAIALGAYINGISSSLPSIWIAMLVILSISFIHAYSIRLGLLFQRISTLFKLVLIVFFIVSGFWLGNKTNINFDLSQKALNEIWDGGWLSPAFAVSLIWVSFAYSGWNATAYIAGSVKEPQKNLTRSIIIGTLLVTVLYTLLNSVFLTSTPLETLVGKKEVGLIAANYLWGDFLGLFMGAIISLLLVSTISSMIFTGPRVIAGMFIAIPKLNVISKESKKGIPNNAIITQAIISIIMLWTMDFESLIYYVAFTLSLFTLITVIGMLKLRFTHGKPEGYSAWGYPFTPILFIVTTASVCIFFIGEKPIESILGVSTALIGLIFWFLKSRSTLNA